MIENSNRADYNSIIPAALRLCQPPANEVKKLTNIAHRTMELVTGYCRNIQEVKEIVFGGSFAKGTWLKGDADIDIFIRIDPSVNETEFERLGIEIGSKALDKYGTFLRYSDHPYVESVIEGVKINIVPCYMVENGKWKSAADRSPYHTQYVIDNLDDSKRKDVRLLKKFLKITGIYGAEISTNGFSGYVSEVLILKYGSFGSVLDVMSKLEENTVISIYPPDDDIIKSFPSALIIIDPVDLRRNLGAAISAESVAKFILASRTFLEKPSLEFFKVNLAGNAKKLHLKTNKIVTGKLSHIIVVEFKHAYKSPDIIWGQMKKSLNSLTRQLEIAGFKIIKNTCITDEKTDGAFIFMLESTTLPQYIAKTGPSVYMREETSRFVLKNKESHLLWVGKNMRVIALGERKETDAKKFIKSMLSHKIQSSGITAGLAKDVQKSFQIYTGKERRIKGLVKDAINEITTTDALIFR